VLLFLAWLWHKHPSSGPLLLRPLTEAEQADEAAAKIDRDSIAIPAMDLTATVVDAQMDSSGRMRLPNEAHTLARFESGARFDSDAGAVLVTGGKTGGLARLAELRVGSIVVTRGFDPAQQWRVTKVGSYTSDSGVTKDIFRGAYGARQLYLVSCTGTLSITGNCPNNVVAVAVPLSGTTSTATVASSPTTTE
jgi:hypothetical protein